MKWISLGKERNGTEQFIPDVYIYIYIHTHTCIESHMEVQHHITPIFAELLKLECVRISSNPLSPECRHPIVPVNCF